MAISRRQVGTAATVYQPTTGTTSNLPITLTSSALANSLLIGAWTIDKNAGTISAPAGWTEILNRPGLSVSLLVAYKVAAGGETGATASWSTVAKGAAGYIAEYQGVFTANPFGPSDLSSYSDTARTSLAFTPSAPNSNGVALGIMAIDSLDQTNAGFSPAATNYSLISLVRDTAGANGNPAIVLEEAITTSGSANTPTFNWTASDQAQGVLLQLNDSASAAIAPVVNVRVVGIPTATTAVIAVNVTNTTSARLKVGTDPAVTQNVVFGPSGTPNGQGDVRLTVSGLTTSTRQFYYRVAAINSAGTEVLDTLLSVGTFRTAPTGVTSFAFDFGSCTDGTDSAAIGAIANRDDDLFFHLGDLYYSDGSPSTVANIRSLFTAKLTSANHANLLATTPSVYTPSDHEALVNNSVGGDDPATWAIWNQVYREKWAAPASIPSTLGVYHTFVWGRVRFIVLDDRSLKSATSLTDNSAKSALGTVQKQWLKDTITNAAEQAIVIAQSGPWQGTAPDSAPEDGWTGYLTERNELAAFFAASGKTIVMLAGDMHSLAASNSSLAPGGITLFHAAPFNNDSSIKQPPYTVGPYPSSTARVQQYGRVAVTDDGTNITLAYTGYSSDNTARVTLSTTATTSPPPPPGTGGNAKVWNGTTWAVKPVKYWNGTTWATGALKRWNGTAWVATTE